MSNQNQAQRDKIAIVGCGLRLPGDIDSLDALWDFLVDGGDAISDLPDDRWVNDLYDPQPRAGRTYVRRGGYLSSLERIDMSFMGVSPREALQIDPQQRLLVDTAYEALEQAGLPLQKLARGRTGVFVGLSSNDYIQAMNDDIRRSNAYTNTGGALSIAANRISYLFDLRGPSFALDTACSSGLTAFDAAVRSLHQGSCELAIVGAANALIRAEPFVGFAQATMLSPAGQCRAFDADGRGFVRAEGAVSFVLKPLPAALRDRDPILCVVEGSDTNNDGRTSGLSLPNGEAQQALIERVLRENAIEPANIAYFEAHGTGTAAGDPIEAGAIGRAIATQRPGHEALLLGSIKSNIGHLEPASGLAGLAKAILCLNRGAAPQSLHFETPNPAIDFAGLRLQVVQRLTPLPSTPGPRMAAVNSFGFGGANAHVVVSEPSPQPSAQASNQPSNQPSAPSSTAPPCQMERPWIMVSGRSPGAMRAVAAQVAEYMDAHDDRRSLGDLSAALLTRRTWHTHRAAVWADDMAAMRSALETIARDALPATAVLGSPTQGARTGFVFSGNGPQWWGMGRELYAASSTFRATLDEVDAILRGLSDLKLIDEMHRDEADKVMARTEIAQPALFALQLALVRCLAEDGLVADGVVGHSAGELAAAYCAGLFDLETILRIVSARSQQQGKTAGDGAMAAIGLGLEEAQARLRDLDGLVVAGDNGPEAVSVAGPVERIDALVEALSAQGTFARKLRLNYAFHSAAMDRIETPFRALVGEVQGSAGQRPFYSTVTGTALSSESMDADYWWRNLREPVRFHPAIERMLDDGYGVFVEVGPHPALLGYVTQIARRANRSCQTVETLRRGENELTQRRKTIATAAVRGAAIDLARLFPQPVPPLDLPRYPWQYERAFNRPSRRAPLIEASEQHALLGAKVSLAQDTWVNEIALSRIPFLKDHLIRDSVLFPAAGFLEMAVSVGQAALDATGQTGQIELSNLQIDKALPLDDEQEILLQTFFDRTDHSLSIQSRPIALAKDGEETAPVPFTEHVRATIAHRPLERRRLDLDQLKASLSHRFRAPDEHYRLCEARGLNYGPMFRTVAGQHLGDGEVLVELKRQVTELDAFMIDPTLIDGALQALIGLIDNADDERLFVPAHLGRLTVFGSTKAHQNVYAHIVARRANRFFLSADLKIIATDGRLLAELEDMQVRAVGRGAGKEALRFQHRLKPLRLFDDSLPAVATDALLANGPRLPAPEQAGLGPAGFGEAIDRLCAAFAADTLARLSEGKTVSLQHLVDRGRLDARHRRYAETLVANALAQGFASGNGDRFRVEHDVAPDVIRAPQALWQEIAQAYPAQHAELFLAARVWQRLPALLAAELAPTDQLFPPAGSALLEQVYEHGFHRRGANTRLAAAIANYIEQIPDDRPLRLLEIGGGMGGATAELLRSIDVSRVDYVFTDTSDDALASAERRFASTPSFQTRTLDLAAIPDATELGGPFDILVCAHALHRMPTVRHGLAAMRRLLRGNGLIALIEPERNAYVDFVFGVLPEAWSFTDSEDRPEHALLSGSAWSRLLESTGFTQVARWSDAVDGTLLDGSLLDGPIEDSRPSASLLLGLNRPAQRLHPTPTDDRPEPLRWLFLFSARADDGTRGLMHALRAQIEAGGGRVAKLDLDGAPVEVEAPCAAFADETSREPPARVVVFAPEAELAHEVAADTAWPLVAFIKAASTRWAEAPRIDILTRNALAGEPANLAGAMVWAVGRTIVNEHPNWRCQRVDHDGSASAQSKVADWLLGLPSLVEGISETVDELRFTARGISANRIEPLGTPSVIGGAADQRALQSADKPVDKPADEPSGAAAFAVTLSAQGSLDNLAVKALPPTSPPVGDEVEIALHAAGLNFKDVILALGLLPPELLKDSAFGPLMGLEGAGVVSGVGPEVTALRPGDRVMLMQEGCFGSTVKAPEGLVRRIPEGWSFAEAATLPIVGLTVVYTLDILARLQPGETLLVHGGAGGTGLMAIQFAKAVGARVIATAGSEEKRDLLRMLEVDGISDSRSLSFAADVRKLTNGAGVDVVLNSLAGDAMLASLDLVKPFGRFVEIGKRDIEANHRLNLKALENNVSFHAVDLTFLPHHRPDLFTTTWNRLIALCESGAIRPLPLRTYRLSGLREALRLMQSGRHLGKLVLDLTTPDSAVVPLPKPPHTFAADGVHLISGGLGGIGLRIAHWMAERGARRIALVGRSGVKTDDQRTAIAAIEAAGAEVIIAQADVADAAQVTRLIETLTATHGRIAGIMHAVLVLDDALMINMTAEAFERVVRPKVAGARHLHRETLSQALDYFVMFSSLANVAGNPGQANYVAANAYLERLVEARRSAGLPGLALQLGAVADAGVLARDAALREQVSKQIGGAIRVEDILHALDDLLEADVAVAAVLDRAGRFAGPIMQSARLEALADQTSAQQETGSERIDFAAIPIDERAAQMERLLVQILARVTGAKDSQIDTNRSLMESGLDSLMAVELAMEIERRIGIALPAAELSQDRSLSDLALAVLSRLNVEVATAGTEDSDDESARMQADSRLPRDLVVTEAASEVPIAERNAVLMTGATGFLGTFLLDELVRRGARRIICLGRGRDAQHAAERLASSLQQAGLERAKAEIGRSIEVWPCELSLAGFGLSDERLQEIIEEVDLVLHNAAAVDFLGSYPKMAPVNVGSVRELVQLCTQGRPKAFHFVSTLRIFARIDQIAGTEVSEAVDPWEPPSDEGGYVKTKWVADQFVQMARAQGLGAGIYRPSFVIGRRADGFSNVSDLGSALARFALDTGMLPDVKTAMPIIPIDVAAHRIAAFIDRPGEQYGVRHITDWPSISMQEIKAIGETKGMKIDLVPLPEFIARATSFFERNPRHPAIWLPAFFESGAAENPLGTQLTPPVLPEGDTFSADEAPETLGRMLDWFRARRDGAELTKRAA